MAKKTSLTIELSCQIEQLKAELAAKDKRIEYHYEENRKLREYICFDCEGREDWDNCADWLQECNEKCNLEQALKGGAG